MVVELVDELALRHHMRRSCDMLPRAENLQILQLNKYELFINKYICNINRLLII